MKWKHSVLVLVFALSACAWADVKPIGYQDRSSEGVRVYDPKPLLIVTPAKYDKEGKQISAGSTTLTFIPDYTRGYAVTFGTFLAKNKASVQIKEGILTQFDSDQDTTGLLSLLQSLGSEALKNVDKLAALGEEISSAIPGLDGIYEFVFDENGTFIGLRKINVDSGS